MNRLSARTVFHKIQLKRDNTDLDAGILGDGIPSMPEPDWEEYETSPPRIDSDEEWDTDLETEGCVIKSQYMSDGQVKKVYLAACRQLNIVPANCFLKAIGTEVMNLNFQGLGPTGARTVATAMLMNVHTTQLYLAGNFIGHGGIRNVCEMLKENEYITHLDLSENDLDSYAADMISNVFKVNDNLTFLNLSGNHFKDYDAEHFAAMLRVGSRFRNGQFTGLRNIDLSHNVLGDIGARILGHALGDNETLTHINLSWNQIRTSGIRCISKGVEENTCLTSFDISSNGVDNLGAELLGKALVHNRTLTDLNLSSNRVGLEGISSLFKYIGKNDCLKSVRLTNNPITLQGPVAALTHIQQSDVSVLEELEIADACVPREFGEVLEQVRLTRPQFRVQLGGFMNSRDMCKKDVKSHTEAWKKDPVLVFIRFIEDRSIKVFDMFKLFDKDKSCSLTRDEFKTGLSRIGCPMKPNEVNHLLDVLDSDRSGEIDIMEFMDGFNKHKRRLAKYNKYGTSRGSSPSSRDNSRPSSQTSILSPLHTSDEPVSSSRPSTLASDSTWSQATSSPLSQFSSRTASKMQVHVDDRSSESRTFLEPPTPLYSSLQDSNNQASANKDTILPVQKSLTIA